jgi:hypothetical protein
MTQTRVTQALSFISTAPLPTAPLAAAGGETGIDFDAVKQQAAVVGSEVVSFVQGVTPEQRGDIVHACLLAQLSAKAKTPAPDSLAAVRSYYHDYFAALGRLGFAGQAESFVANDDKGTAVEVHKAILEVATGLLKTPSPTGLAVLASTLEALKSLAEDSPWITLFDRESRNARVARFQVSLVDKDPAGQLLLTTMAFGMEATSTVTAVLFFKVAKTTAKLEHHSGTSTIDAPVLATIREPLQEKLAAHVVDFVKGVTLPAPIGPGR